MGSAHNGLSILLVHYTTQHLQSSLTLAHTEEAHHHFFRIRMIGSYNHTLCQYLGLGITCLYKLPQDWGFSVLNLDAHTISTRLIMAQQLLRALDVFFASVNKPVREAASHTSR
jgi:hypothetical protein